MRLVVIGAEGSGTQALCEWSTQVKTSEAGTNPVAHGSIEKEERWRYQCKD